MPAIAFLSNSLQTASIDASKGVVSGVKVMEVGRLACFAGKDGAPTQTLITGEHINALLSHAGNRSIPVHFTHDWAQFRGTSNADSEEMKARIGALKALRKDDSGNLIADLHLKPGQVANDIFWGAEHNPEDNMLSAVFEYRQDDPKCIPVSFRACDVVPQGAATTALFSAVEPQPKTTMPPDADFLSQFKAALADPDVLKGLKAIIKSVESSAAPVADPSPEDTSAMLSEAGVTDADKKSGDEKLPVAMRASIQINRATARLAKTPAFDEEELLKKAEARFTKSIGANPALRDLGNSTAALSAMDSAIETAIAAGAKDRPTAILRVAKDKPEIYNAHMAALNSK